MCKNKNVWMLWRGIGNKSSLSCVAISQSVKNGSVKMETWKIEFRNVNISVYNKIVHISRQLYFTLQTFKNHQSYLFLKSDGMILGSPFYKEGLRLINYG